MKKVKKWRYYCDFCNKNLGHAFYMERHEKHCTNNPDRGCRVCYFASLDNFPVKDLIQALGNGGVEGLRNLREKAEDCPACMLAAIRQKESDSLLCANYEFVIFDYKKESKSFFSDFNNEHVDYHG